MGRMALSAMENQERVTEVRKTMRDVVAVVTVIASAVAATTWAEPESRSFWRFNPQKERETTAKPATPIQAVKSPMASTNTVTKSTRAVKKSRATVNPRRAGVREGDVVVYRDSDGKPYPDADQKIMAAADAAIDQDDLAAARSLAEKALASDNADLKEKVVDALGWFGESAMAELTQFMSDPNEEVAEKAVLHWKDALQEMDDDGNRAMAVSLALSVVKNKDVVEDVADELIGIDEAVALKVLAKVIEGDNTVAADTARETYECITGEKWAGVDAAKKWLQENYTPPAPPATNVTTRIPLDPNRTPAERGVRPVDAIHAKWGVLTGFTPVEKLDGSPIGDVPGGHFFEITKTIITPAGLMVIGTFVHQETKQTVRIPAEKINCLTGSYGYLSTNQQDCLRMYYKLTGDAEELKARLMRDAAKRSPYLQDAANALRELRAHEKAIEKLKGADADTLRKAAYEISQLRVKLHELNQKHKEWKEEHAAELPDPEKDPAYLSIIDQRRRYADSIPGLTF